MTSESMRSTKVKVREPPRDLVTLTNFKYTDNPHPMVECTVPGLSQEAFDREWNPKATSIMWVDAVTRRCLLHKPFPTQKNSSDQTQMINKMTLSDTMKTSLSLSEQNSDEGSHANSENAGEDTSNNAGTVPATRSVHPNEERYFLDWPRLEKDFFAFGSCVEISLSRALYDPAVPKWPLDFRLTLGHVGPCSVAKTEQYYARLGGGERALLWSNRHQRVIVDKKTRKPARVPAWFLNKYQGRGCLEQGITFRPFKRPAVTYCHRVQVQWSETDEYGHANWASYMKWVTDALHAALLPKKTGNSTTTNPSQEKSAQGQPGGQSQQTSIRGAGALCGITEETVRRGLAKFQVTYYRECLEGDQIQAHVWQDKRERDQGPVYGCVMKAGEEICEIKLWYFTDDE
ncbi:hypothetical protein PoB_001989300 [Plakobranchus ocellatus]|uniref:Uncharacterized protein n=1 Tax=Plakobranchus ocellatus TaxID=259542 RepID=A0AAV3ZFL0_9GAST|nr:hypothetical protein PoB_001989300 [Plakobranchus ocellatus]